MGWHSQLPGGGRAHRVGLALLKTAEGTLAALPFERLLTALNSKQYPAFSQPPAQLLKLALSFRVSKRLAQYAAEYQRTAPAQAANGAKDA